MNHPLIQRTLGHVVAMGSLRSSARGSASSYGLLRLRKTIIRICMLHERRQQGLHQILGNQKGYFDNRD
jgi:hypothetical protein